MNCNINVSELGDMLIYFTCFCFFIENNRLHSLNDLFSRRFGEFVSGFSSYSWFSCLYLTLRLMLGASFWSTVNVVSPLPVTVLTAVTLCSHFFCLCSTLYLIPVALGGS